MSEAPSKRCRHRPLDAGGSLWYYEGASRCSCWWDLDWVGDPSMTAWFWEGSSALSSGSADRECHRRDAESRRRIFDADDAPTREIEVAVECAHFRDAQLHAGERAFLRMLCRRRCPLLQHPVRAMLGNMAGFTLPGECGPCPNVATIVCPGSATFAQANASAPAESSTHVLASIMDPSFLFVSPSCAADESMDDLLADLYEDVTVYLRTPSHLCKMVASPRQSLWDILQNAKSGADTLGNMRKLVIIYQGKCYEGRTLRSTLESTGVNDGDTFIVLPTSRRRSEMQDPLEMCTDKNLECPDQIDWLAIDVDFFGGLRPDRTYLSQGCRRATAVVTGRFAYIFGDVLINPESFSEEMPSLCVLDLNTGSITGMSTKGGDDPGPLRGHATVLHADRYMVVTGGIWSVPLARGQACRTWPVPTILPLQGMVLDVYSLDLHTLTWKAFARKGWQPGAMFQHSAVLNESGDLALIFGGYRLCPGTSLVGEAINGTTGSVVESNDLYLLNLATHEWSNLTSVCTGRKPTPRHSQCAAVHDGELFIYGGMAESAGCLHDLHVLCLSSLVWTEVTSVTLPSHPLGLAAMGSLYLLDISKQGGRQLTQLELKSMKVRSYQSVQIMHGDVHDMVVFMDFNHFYRLHMSDNYLLCVCEVDQPLWTPENHRYFPIWFQKLVRQTLLLQNRTTICPVEALFQVFSFFHMAHGSWFSEPD